MKDVILTFANDKASAILHLLASRGIHPRKKNKSASWTIVLIKTSLTPDEIENLIGDTLNISCVAEFNSTL